MKWTVPIACMLACACKPHGEAQQAANNAASAPISEAPAPAPATPGQNAETTDDRTPLAEPKGAIDPKSVEAAGQIVQSYGALIEQRRWAEARMLWGDAATAAKFEGELAKLGEVHLEIGNLGESEGAAGSIYVTMPVIFYGDQKDGQPFRRMADVVLRRVNDVPGSTEAQRRWHIQQIAWKDAP